MERYKNQVKNGGRHAPKPPCYMLSLSQSLYAKPIPTDQSLIWWLLLLLLSYCCIVTRKLFFCVFCEYLCLFLCLTCVAMVLLLSPHAVPVVSSLWIRVLVRDAEHSLPLPRRWSPADAGPLFHWTCRKCSSIVTTIPAHRKTPEARTTATVAATEVTAAHLLWKTIPTFYISFLLALALSDSVTL